MTVNSDLPDKGEKSIDVEIKGELQNVDGNGQADGEPITAIYKVTLLFTETNAIKLPGIKEIEAGVIGEDAEPKEGETVDAKADEKASDSKNDDKTTETKESDTKEAETKDSKVGDEKDKKEGV